MALPWHERELAVMRSKADQEMAELRKRRSIGETLAWIYKGLDRAGWATAIIDTGALSGTPIDDLPGGREGVEQYRRYCIEYVAKASALAEELYKEGVR